MTNRERVKAALEHRQPDKVPYCLTFTHAAREKMAAFYGDADFEAGLGNCFTVHSAEPENAWQEESPGIWRDQFGVEWDRTVDRDIGVVVNTLVDASNVDAFPFPDTDDPTRYAHLDAAVAAAPESVHVVDLGFTLFERAWTLTGMENVLMAMAADKGFANALLDRVTAWNMELVERVCAHPIDAIWFGDDWGSQTGLIMGPQMWREFIGPRICALFKRVKSHGKYVFIHSCGKVTEVFPDLIEAGLDVFNPFQPEVIDVFEAKQRHGDRLCFWGGISTQRTLPYGTPEETREEVRRLLEEVGDCGGYFAAPAHDIPADAKPENIAAMIEALKEQ